MPLQESSLPIQLPSTADCGLAFVGITADHFRLVTLDSDEGAQDVLDVYQRVNDLGINSIPTVVVNGKYVVNGAARAERTECSARRSFAMLGSACLAAWCAACSRGPASELRAPPRTGPAPACGRTAAAPCIAR